MTKVAFNSNQAGTGIGSNLSGAVQGFEATMQAPTTAKQGMLIAADIGSNYDRNKSSPVDGNYAVPATHNDKSTADVCLSLVGDTVNLLKQLTDAISLLKAMGYSKTGILSLPEFDQSLKIINAKLDEIDQKCGGKDGIDISAMSQIRKQLDELKNQKTINVSLLNTTLLELRKQIAKIKAKKQGKAFKSSQVQQSVQKPASSPKIQLPPPSISLPSLSAPSWDDVGNAAKIGAEGLLLFGGALWGLSTGGAFAR